MNSAGFFMSFCDNNLSVINTFPASIIDDIEELEQQMHTMETREEFASTKALLSSIITQICKLKLTNKHVLRFIGGLTLIERNMEWKDGKGVYLDINDKNVLV